MQVTNLRLKNFRNYADLTLALSSGINIFLGANAQGKTNILEAICYASLGRSHRTHQDSDLIRFSEPAGILQLAFSRRDVPSRIDIQLPRKGRRKLLLNGQSIRPKDLVGSLNTVLFSPEDLFLIKGAPAGRRHFLDSEISQASPAYYHELLTFGRLLQQRNTLLKRIREHHAAPALLAPWDPQLAASAAKILLTIIDKFQGGPVGISTIATAIGEDAGTVEEVYEPYLIMEGFMKRTPRGRVLTELAYKHLGRNMYTSNVVQPSLFD